MQHGKTELPGRSPTELVHNCVAFRSTRVAEGYGTMPGGQLSGEDRSKALPGEGTHSAPNDSTRSGEDLWAEEI